MRRKVFRGIKLSVLQLILLKERYISRRNFLIILCIVVGILAAVSAVLLKRTAIFLEELLSETMHGSFLQNSFFIYPLIGITLTVLVVRWGFKNRFQNGVSHIIYAIAKKNSNLERRNIWSHLLTSALTVSMGGSVGLEAPIVNSGSAIGSNVGKTFKITHQEKTLLLASGAAAGIAAIFNSPIAGAIFSLEVLLVNFSIPHLIPIIISTATASVVSQVLFPEKLYFPITNAWHISSIPFYVLLGIGVGFMSVYMIRSSLAIEHYFAAQPKKWKRIVYAGVPLCALIFLFPPLFGEGYITMQALLNGMDKQLTANSIFSSFNNNGWLLLLVAIFITFFKVVASSLTIGAGGNGGIFGPALFTGSFAGFVFSRFINLTGLYPLIESNFMVAGMAGIIAGVIHAPLTGIFLIAEITGGYALFIPLMIVSAISYFVTRPFERYSIYHKQLAEDKHINFNNETEPHAL